MAILRYLTKLASLQIDEQEPVREIVSERGETTTVGLLSSYLSRALHAYLLESMRSLGLNDIEPAHGDVLNVLYRHGATTMTELARHTHRTKATVSVLVTKLERLGYVQRCANEMDARSIVVVLTDKGEASQVKFERISKDMNQMIREILSPKEVDDLEQLMHKVYEKLKRGLDREND